MTDTPSNKPMANGNAAAYPITAADERDTNDAGWGSAGLTKREYFAGLAMQGLLANPSEETCKVTYERTAEWSVAAADALLAELSK